MSLIIAVVVLGSAALAVVFPERAERLFRIMMMFKTYVLGAVGLIFAGLFLSTGDFFLMLIGALVIAYGVWYIAFESDFEVGLSG